MTNNIQGEKRQKGRIEVICGSMFSGKTEELIRRLKRAKFARQKVEIFKPAIDTRYSEEEVVSHDHTSILSTPVESSGAIMLLSSDIDVVGIDEAQFLSREQVDQLARIVDDYGSNIVCYGLRTDFQSNMFEGSKRLFEIADSIDEVKSTCSCGRKTIINARIDKDGTVLTSRNQVEIGGYDKYIAMCRRCWRNRRLESAEKYSLFKDSHED